MQQLYAEALGDLPDIFWKASEGQVGLTEIYECQSRYRDIIVNNIIPTILKLVQYTLIHIHIFIHLMNSTLFPSSLYFHRSNVHRR